MIHLAIESETNKDIIKGNILIFNTAEELAHHYEAKGYVYDSVNNIYTKNYRFKICSKTIIIISREIKGEIKENKLFIAKHIKNNCIDIQSFDVFGNMDDLKKHYRQEGFRYYKATNTMKKRAIGDNYDLETEYIYIEDYNYENNIIQTSNINPKTYYYAFTDSFKIRQFKGVKEQLFVIKNTLENKRISLFIEEETDDYIKVYLVSTKKHSLKPKIVNGNLSESHAIKPIFDLLIDDKIIVHEIYNNRILEHEITN